MIWQTGTCIGNKYTIERVLGEGGFGITYLARDKQHRPHVIKTIREGNIPPDRLEYFRGDIYNEALRLARVSDHPRIVSAHEIVHHQGSPCIIMEYIDGPNLENWLTEGARSIDEILDYIRQIGEALEYIHERGILHRDIKPQNIILRESDREAVLIDFGIARSYDVDRATSISTVQFRSGGYTPIEQIYPRSGNLQPYTDVYALAATLYYCLTATLPPLAEERATATAGDPLVKPRELNAAIDPRVERAILAGMALHPTDRPSGVREWLSLWEEDPAGTIPAIPPLSPTVVAPGKRLPIGAGVPEAEEPVKTVPVIAPLSPPLSPTVVVPRKRLPIGAGVLAIGLVGLSGLWFGKNIITGLFPAEKRDAFLRYSQQGLSVDYPADWRVTSFEASPFDPTIARFTPRENESDPFVPAIAIGVQELPTPITIEEVSEQKARELETNLPSATRIGKRQLKLNERDAYELVYKGKEGDREIRKQQVGILQARKLYTITYEADAKEYSAHEKDAGALIDSVNLTP